MSRIHPHHLTLATLCCLALACGGSGTDSAPPPAVEAPKAAAADPCSLLDADLVRAVFPVEEGAEVTVGPGIASAALSCVASWPVPDREEAEKRSMEAMQEYFRAKAGGAGDPGPIPVPHLEHQVRLTLAGNRFDDAAAARAAFDVMLADLAEGITAEATVSGRTVEHTFKIDYEKEVDGVGDRAAWAPKPKQLSVVSGSTIFHLIVDLGPEGDNEGLAVEAARRIAGSL